MQQICFSTGVRMPSGPALHDDARFRPKGLYIVEISTPARDRPHPKSALSPAPVSMATA